ncbi:kinase [Frigidibacter sp. MR17.14]|uniref:YcjF family protein n=1 Tax=Frigidibacter sp. MR17.14 TaxID=3126509 RepID=UPI003012A3A1
MFGSLLDYFSSAPKSGDEPPVEQAEQALPILWMLGKTAAGKSSLIRLLTALDAVEIGNGFTPCTRSARRFDFPPGAPLLRFLDTRGLGEARYDPAEDLASCAGHSHALLLVCRLDDPVQGELAAAAGAVLRQGSHAAGIVYTGADLIPDPEARRRARSAIAAQLKRAIGRDLPAVEVALPETDLPESAPPGAAARQAVIDLLVELLPSAALLLERRATGEGEQAAFDRLRNRVLFYAGLAGSSDALPVVGAVSVPGLQAAMLRDLAAEHGVGWTTETVRAFLGALGAGILLRYSASFGLRQAAKLIPVYGQTLGAAVSGSISFGATYALGRAASYFLYRQSQGKPADEAELRETFRRAFARAADGGGDAGGKGPARPSPAPAPGERGDD